MTTGGGVRAAFSPDGGTLAVASADGRLKTFDTGEFFRLEKEMKEKEREKERGREESGGGGMCFSCRRRSAPSRSLLLYSLRARDKAPLLQPMPLSLGAVSR